MAIMTGFTRDERYHEVDGCPLRTLAATSSAACGTCRYNVAHPGEERVGCVTNTGFAAYEAALAALAAEPELRASLLALLERQRQTGAGLAAAELTELARIAERWATIIEEGAPGREVALTARDFARAGLALGEPARILA